MGSVELLGAMGDTSICELVPLCPAWSGPKMSRSPLLFIPDTFSLLAIRVAPAPAEGDNTWRWSGGSGLRAMEGESGSGREARVVTTATSRSQTLLQSGHCPSHHGPSLHRNCVATKTEFHFWEQWALLNPTGRWAVKKNLSLIGMNGSSCRLLPRAAAYIKN